MRAPSLKTLRAAFPSEDCELLRRILKASREELEDMPGARELIRDSYGEHMTYRLRMEALNTAGDFYGVEYISHKSGRTLACYLNSGDTYCPTIMRYFNGRTTYRVTTMGDFVESYERRYGRVIV